ncbi:hypothetical protein BDV32DRAFT_125542 [Aspergillus pseudonomiae]|nr:hypothetical protein BDV32DRAFT_125542 [Aspergillus pseudonomiae]
MYPSWLRLVISVRRQLIRLSGQGMTKGDCLCQKTPQAEQISGMDDPRLRMFHQRKYFTDH